MNVHLTAERPLDHETKPPTATERHAMLIAAGKEFEAKHPNETVEETANRMIAAGEFTSHQTCAHCGVQFEPRRGTGGRPQKFCNESCKRSSQRTQRTSQHPPTPNEASAVELEDFCWKIAHQDEIVVSATTNGEIELEQRSEDTRIFVTRSNAVHLARCILYATGFGSVLIATGAGGGWCDVDDGDLPEHFE